MAEASFPQNHDCTNCGGPAHRLPALEHDGFLIVCDQCGHVQPGAPPGETRPDPRSRLRSLISSDSTPSPASDVPEELLEDLPEHAKTLLSRRRAASERPTLPSVRQAQDSGEQSEAAATEPKIEHAASSWMPQISPQTGELNPEDIVRLAAEAEGATPPPGQQRPCPHCRAIVSTSDDVCPWCSQPIPPDEADDG